MPNLASVVEHGAICYVHGRGSEHFSDPQVLEETHTCQAPLVPADVWTFSSKKASSVTIASVTCNKLFCISVLTRRRANVRVHDYVGGVLD